MYSMKETGRAQSFLCIDGVGKQYTSKNWGLREFDLKVGAGVIGLLGLNGACNFPLMRMLTTITHPSEGTIKWNGVDIARCPNTLRFSTTPSQVTAGLVRKGY